MKKPRRFTLVNQTWQYAVIVVLAGTFDEAVTYYYRRFGKPPEKKAAHLGSTIFVPEERSHVIWFRDSKPDTGIVAHEALHSVQHALSTAGLGPMSDATEEAYAYALMWTVREITHRL